MKASNDFIRQSARFTMNGLIDPRLLPDYSADKKAVPTTHVTLLALFLKSIENLIGIKKDNGHAPV
jgi:hypothetical protein